MLFSAIMAFVTTADSPDKGYAVGAVFFLGAVLGAMAGLHIDKRAQASKSANNRSG